MKELKIELQGKTKNEIHREIFDKQREHYNKIVNHNIIINQDRDNYKISLKGPVMGFNFVLNGSIEVFDGYIILSYEHNLENSFVDNALESILKRELN